LARATLAALEMCARTADVVPEWRARAGLYQGPLVSGLVGEVRYQFDIWGDTVNVASRLCGVSGPGTVAMTAEQWGVLQGELEALRELSVCCSAASLGERSLKGLGQIEVMEVTPEELTP
jgi:class 3 adenylate cyclase